MKRALVLAGGGARGAFQVGMLRNLVLTRGLDFQIIRGVSVGALNASFLAQAPAGSDEPASLVELKKKVGELENLWRNEIKGNHSVYSSRPGGLLGLAAGADSLYSLEPLKRLLKKHLSDQALKNSGRDFKVGVVSLVQATYSEAGPDDPCFRDKLLASASIPVVFPFVDLKQQKDVLVDGGARNITPLSSVFAAGATEVFVLLTSRLVRHGNQLPESGVQADDYEQWDDDFLGTKVGGFDVLKRTVEILTDEVYLDDIRGALDWNAVLKAIEAVHGAAAAGATPTAGLSAAVERLRQSTDKRYVPIHVLAPQEWFGEKNSSTEFSPKLIAQAIAHGEAVAADAGKWLWPPA
jgi:NTE family protein